MSDAHEAAIQAEKNPANAAPKLKPAETGVAAASQAAKSLLEALTEFGKLALVVLVLIFLWSNRAPVQNYAVQWLDSANKLGFLGWSIERQASAEEAVAKIAKDKSTLTNAKFAEGAIERAARNAPAIVGSRILWVDDHPSNNDLEREVLEALGIEVFPVKSNKEALTFLPVVRPDLVISDIGRDKEEALPLINCPAHYFAAPGKGDLAAVNIQLMHGKTTDAGFSLPEAIATVDSRYTTILALG